jgi:AcrR family transcriptional regulator
VANGATNPPTPRAGSAAWWHQREERPRRTSILTAERIVDAAIEALDEEGLDAFSMRRLAERLGTAHGSLYRHFESRDAVLVAVHDHVIGQIIDVEPPGDAWDQRLANMVRGLHALLQYRPYLAEVWRTTEQMGPNAMRARERALALLMESGISPEAAARAYQLVLHYTISFAVLEQGMSFRTPEVRRATAERFRSLDADEFPMTTAMAEDLAFADLEDEFELGLRTLFAAIRDPEAAQELIDGARRGTAVPSAPA